METTGGTTAATPARPSLARSLSWMAAGQVSTQATWYGSLLVLAAILPPKAFGTVAVGMVIVQVAWMLIDSGIGGSLVVAPELSRAQVRGAVRFNVAVGVLLGGAVFVSAGPAIGAFARGGDPNVLRALAVGILVYSLAVVPLALIQRALVFRLYAFVMVGSAAISSVAGIALGFGGAGVWALVVRQVAFQSLIAVLAWIVGRRFLPAHRGERRVRWFRPPQSASFMVLTLTNFLAFNVDYMIVGRLTDSRLVGIYSLAFTLAFAPLTQIAAQVGRVFLSATAATDDPAAIARRTLAVMRTTGLVLFPAVPAAIVLAPWVLPAVFGREWSPMVVPFEILVVAGVGQSVLEILGNALAGAGQMPFRARWNVPWLAAMVAAMIVLTSVFGIRGAAVAHLTLFVPLALLYLLRGSRLIDLGARPILRALAPVGVAVAAQAAVTAAVLWAAGDGGAGRLAAAAAGLAVAGALLVRGGALGSLRATFGHRRPGASPAA